MTAFKKTFIPLYISKPCVLFVYLMTLLSVSFSSNAEWNHENVVSTSECGECHEEAVDVWKKTAHQKNFKALSKNKDAKAIAKKMGVKKIKKPKALCASCHYTVGMKRNKAKIIAGVSCESCHSPAKDWIELHNDYGGKGINEKTEDATHKKNRLAKLETLGMIRPDNTYGWAKNCLNCHIVANEKLVNVGGHAAGSDFKLSKRTQGEVRHYPKAEIDTLRYYNLVSHATELELSLTALATATGGKYATEMTTRAKNALANLKKANGKSNNAYAQKIITLASGTSIKAGNKTLTAISKNIAANIMQLVQKQTGYPYDKSKLKSASSPAPAKKAVVKTKPKPVAKPTPKPKPIVKKSAPKPVVKVAPPKPKPVVKKSAPKPKPVVKKPKPKPVKKAVAKTKPEPVTTKKVPLVSMDTNNNNQSTASDNNQGALFRQFDVVVPGHDALCQSYTPWVRGKKKLSDNAPLSSDSCFGINISASRLSQLYLFSETNNNQLVQLIPNNCNYLGVTFNALNANKVETIPKSNYKNAAIAVNAKPSIKKLYAIIADNAYANGEMARLASSAISICEIDQQSSKATDTQGFTNMLKMIKKNAGDSMDWRTHGFN